MSDLLQNTYLEKQQVAHLTHQLFAQLDPHDIEHFYASYHSWALQQRIERLRKRMCTLQHQITENMEQLQRVSPSPIANAALAQLQAYGVDDIDLLDRMLERGDTWLDHTLQLLEQCKSLNVIQGTYVQWCEHALEGAYDWVESINDSSPMSSSDEDLLRIADTEQVMPTSEVTEEQLLQKLMSEDETEKYPAIPHLTHSPKTTRPLAEATNVMTTTQPPSPEIAVAEETRSAPVAIEEEIPTQHTDEATNLAQEVSANSIVEAPIAITKKEGPPATVRETKDKPHRQYNWLQRLLTAIWQTIP